MLGTFEMKAFMWGIPVGGFGYAVETRGIEIAEMQKVLTTRESTAHLVWFDDILVYSPSGDADDLVQALIEADEISENYFPE